MGCCVQAILRMSRACATFCLSYLSYSFSSCKRAAVCPCALVSSCGCLFPLLFVKRETCETFPTSPQLPAGTCAHGSEVFCLSLLYVPQRPKGPLNVVGRHFNGLLYLPLPVFCASPFLWKGAFCAQRWLRFLVPLHIAFSHGGCIPVRWLRLLFSAERVFFEGWL